MIASNEPETDEESEAVDLENNNETIFFDLDDYVLENFGTFGESYYPIRRRPYGLFVQR